MDRDGAPRRGARARREGKVVNFAAVMELREAMERGETTYQIGVETLTRAQVERRIAVCEEMGNEAEAIRLHAIINYPVPGIGIGHGFYCRCESCVDARLRAWRAR